MTICDTICNDNSIKTIIKDIEEHPGDYGMECDKLTWLNLKVYLKEELIKRKTIAISDY